MSTTLSPSSISQHLVPSECSRRVWLKANRPELEDRVPGPFDEFIQAQGIRHEERQLEQLKLEHPDDWVDVGGRDKPNAFQETIELVRKGKGLIYQGLLVQRDVTLEGEEVSVIGYPDFMIRFDGGYEISDAKLARAIYEPRKDGGRKLKSKRRYIELQLQLYGWLFRELFPDLEVRLTVRNGKGETEKVPLADGETPLEPLASLLRIRSQPEEPWEPVGWSKCKPCSFKKHCWERAKDEKETGLVPDLNQGLCRKLRDREGIDTYPELLERMSAPELAGIKNKTKGPDDPDNRAGAERILENAQALLDKTPLLRASATPVPQTDLDLLSQPDYVMFDLEGVPPDIDQEWEKVYLWGLQVFGENTGGFQCGLAGFGEDGDEQGWVDFLGIARNFLDDHPDIRFVHWASYEDTKIGQYIERYPHTDIETANEVRTQLLDLLPVTKRLVAVPEPSYSLKVVEAMPAVAAATGFARSEKDEDGEGVSSGDESIAAYMEAVETDDKATRDALMDQIIDYNREDLEATWAVMKWLRGYLKATVT